LPIVCWFQDRLTLSDKGSIDNDLRPFNLLIPSHGFNRFYYRRSLVEDETRHFCYPFHTACWTLLQENNNGNLLKHDIEVLFNIFDSIHYRAHALRWGHNYFLEEMLGSSEEHEDDIITRHKADPAILLDPLHFDFHQEQFQKQTTHSGLFSFYVRRSICNSSGLHSLPTEVFESIMYNLDFNDSRNLLWASGRDPRDLSSRFWESRFWPHGESGFARSIRPSSYSWKDWFFTIQSEMIRGPKGMGLQSRRRIWRLGVDLINLMRAIQKPDRVLHGEFATSYQMRGPVASCLAQKYDSEGCRELEQRFVPLDKRLRAVVPSYTLISNRRLISGLSFVLSDSGCVDVGYVVGRQRDHVYSKDLPNFLWLVSSPLGFEAVSLDVYPQQFSAGSIHTYGNKLAIARWKLENVKGICVGLDVSCTLLTFDGSDIVIGYANRENLHGCPETH
jgi:hypothetical protein